MRRWIPVLLGAAALLHEEERVRVRGPRRREADRAHAARCVRKNQIDLTGQHIGDALRHAAIRDVLQRDAGARAEQLG